VLLLLLLFWFFFGMMETKKWQTLNSKIFQAHAFLKKPAHDKKKDTISRDKKRTKNLINLSL